MSTALYTTIGKLEFDKTVEYFKVPKLNLSNYEEITSSFNDIFESSNNMVNVDAEYVRYQKKLGLNMIPKFESLFRMCKSFWILVNYLLLVFLNILAEFDK